MKEHVKTKCTFIEFETMHVKLLQWAAIRCGILFFIFYLFMALVYRIFFLLKKIQQILNLNKIE